MKPELVLDPKILAQAQAQLDEFAGVIRDGLAPHLTVHSETVEMIHALNRDPRFTYSDREAGFRITKSSLENPNRTRR